MTAAVRPVPVAANDNVAPAASAPRLHPAIILVRMQAAWANHTAPRGYREQVLALTRGRGQGRSERSEPLTLQLA